MIINSAFKRIVLASIILLLLLLFSIFPKEKEYELSLNKDVEYVNNNNTSTIYLIDDNNYVSKTEVVLNNSEITDKIKEMLEILILEGKKESVVPNGFRAIIPADTKVISVKVEDGIAKINFSKNILDINKDMEEKMVEAITYSLTSIDGIKGIIIYVEGEILDKLPQSGKPLPLPITRNFGINKVFDLEKLSNIRQVTVYYINNHNDNYYYVPVTKYVNDNRDKIKIIIDELTSGPIYETNLMSFLNTNTKLLNYEIGTDSLTLNFNSYIFDDIKNKKILEEVIYSIALSVGDNYDVKEVIFKVDNEEIEKSTIGSIE